MVLPSLRILTSNYSFPSSPNTTAILVDSQIGMDSLYRSRSIVPWFPQYQWPSPHLYTTNTKLYWLAYRTVSPQVNSIIPFSDQNFSLTTDHLPYDSPTCFSFPFFFSIWPHHSTHEILVPDQGSNLKPLHWKQTLDHWTSRKVLSTFFFCFVFNVLLSLVSWALLIFPS